MATRSGADDARLSITIAAIVVIHDIGKLDTRFQIKAPLIAEHLRPGSPVEQRAPYDHGTEGLRQMEGEEPELVVRLLGDFGVTLLRAVCGHHGTLPTSDEPSPSRVRLPSKYRDEDRVARRAFLERLSSFFVGLGARLPWTTPVDGPLVQQLAGLCAVADWLGSSSDFFPYSTGAIDESRYWPLALERAKTACSEAGLLRPGATPTDFTALFPGYVPRDVQELTERLSPTEPSLIIVEAAMGQGKTEAALSLAARALNAGLGEGVTIGLPTMATSNAMFERVEAFVPRLFPGAQVQLALAHGRAARQPRFQRLVKHSLKARDGDAPEASVSCARWLLSRKRVLLAQIGVGTIDQALQAALVVRHQFVRMFSLSRNVLILDEIHAYDAYMEVLLEHLLRWLGALDVTVILLSATLPSERRRALIEAWQQAETPGPIEPLELAIASPYPLVTTATKNATRVLALSVPGSRRVTIHLERVVSGGGDHLGTVAQRLLRAAERGARVVWIRNTVREAQDAFAAVRACSGTGTIEATLFHARFRSVDRSEVEQRVLERFGKQCPPGGRVLIATQVVEQSLDLDFDELHSDLAPVDLLLQRAGRLHRHQRQRPAGFEKPRLVLHLPSGPDAAALRFGPSQYVYDAATLWLAHGAVSASDAWRLPEDIRQLVEASYHPESRRRQLAGGGPRLVDFEEKREFELEGRRTRARQACIPPSRVDVDGIAALDDDEQTTQAFTRDGRSITLLPVLWDGARGGALDGEGSWDLEPDRQDAWKTAGQLLDQTLSIPSRGATHAVPPPQVKAWASWGRRFETFCEDAGLGRHVTPLPFARDGDSFVGGLEQFGKRRRVTYSMTLGLQISNASDEEEPA